MVDPLNTKSWVLVPVEPTTEMVGAATRIDFDNEDEVGMTINLWNVMVAAAPPLPAVDGGETQARIRKALAAADDSDMSADDYILLADALSLILSQKGEIERLTADRDGAIRANQALDAVIDRCRQDASDAESRVLSLEEENARLREVMDWYGEHAEAVARYTSAKPPQTTGIGAVVQTLALDAGNRARSALQEKQNG